MVVPGTRKAIKNLIRQQLGSEKTQEYFHKLRLMTYAGEGLAEAIAMAVLRKAGLPTNESGIIGRNRFKDQFWQKIFVTQDRCSVLIRK